MGSGKFWEVMETENAIFQDAESPGKERGFSKWLRKSVGFLFGTILKYLTMDVA